MYSSVPSNPKFAIASNIERLSLNFLLFNCGYSISSFIYRYLTLILLFFRINSFSTYSLDPSGLM